MFRLLTIVTALCTLIFGYIISLEIKKEKQENKLLEAQKDTLKNRCVELLPTLKTKRQYLRLWRSYDHMDFEREEAHDTNYIWDGLNGVILVENDYAVSGQVVVDKSEPETFVNQLRPRGLKHFAEALERVGTSVA
jgi:hypothetical protein